MELEISFNLTGTDQRVKIQGLKIGLSDLNDAIEVREFIKGKARAFAIAKNKYKTIDRIDPLINKKISKEITFKNALKSGLIKKRHLEEIDNNYCPDLVDFNETYAIAKVKRSYIRILLPKK